MQIIQDKHSSVLIEPKSGQVVNWKRQGSSFLYQGSSIRRSGIPVLFPYANPLENGIFIASGKTMPQHGFGRNVPWEYSQRAGNIGLMTLNYGSLSEDARQQYPFDFEATIEITVRDTDSKSYLDYSLCIKNKGETPMPIAPGIHPYFPLSHHLKKSLKIKYCETDTYIPVEKINWEQEMEGNFFEFGNVCADFENFSLTISTDSQDIRYLVLWSQNPATSDSDFVCLEPFTRHTNGINDDPIVVLPQSLWELHVSFTAQPHMQRMHSS